MLPVGCTNRCLTDAPVAVALFMSLCSILFYCPILLSRLATEAFACCRGAHVTISLAPMDKEWTSGICPSVMFIVAFRHTCVKDVLANVAEQVRKDVNDCLEELGFNRLDELKAHSLQSQIRGLAEPSNSVSCLLCMYVWLSAFS